MDKITHQVRAEHWTRILNECMNSGMSKTAWCRANGISECNLRRTAATGAFASGHPAEPNGHLH